MIKRPTYLCWYCKRLVTNANLTIDNYIYCKECYDKQCQK